MEMTVAEYIEHAKSCRSVVYRWIKEGIPHSRSNGSTGKILIQVEAADQWRKDR